MAQIAKNLDFCELRRNFGIRRKKTELREVAWSCVTLRGVAWPAWAVCVVLRGVAWSCVVLRGAPLDSMIAVSGHFSLKNINLAQKHKFRTKTTELFEKRSET